MDSAELSIKGGKEMARVNMKDRVSASWGAKGWPPKVGDKIRVWAPVELRGRKVSVVATDKAFKKGFKVASEGKVRVKVGDEVFIATRREIMPGNVTEKQIVNQ